ncbi:hypothetical protein LMG26411_01213 [Cupriavidus numazuensis]|uniref:Uncharacterized protein n=1 Tax=Cupriavidus numazuensis TaxID=221992 RepID=A0ABN7PSW4_9BURK|nr:hypothetical protein LMG26411_01213 [Cupriavidus numazuensis]
MMSRLLAACEARVDVLGALERAGVGTEHAGLSAIERGQLAERRSERLPVCAILRQQIERIVIGGTFLPLGKLRVDELFTKIRDLR